MRIFFSTVFILLLFSCTSIQTTEYELKFNSENETKIRILQISDFHSNDFGKNEEKLLKLIYQSQPDLIVLTGDIFDFEQKKLKPVKNVELLLDGIKDLCPFYYVTGNHEYYRYHNNEYGYMIEKAGGKSLNDEALLIQINKQNLIMAGLNDPFSDLAPEERLKDKDNKEAYEARVLLLWEKVQELQKTNENTLKILLAHRPEYIEKYKETGFDLVLSGHAHGGQWRAPGINGLYAPMQGLFPKYAGGKYEFKTENGNITMIVSRGLSYQQPKLPRIMNNPELAIIDIVYKKFN